MALSRGGVALERGRTRSDAPSITRAMVLDRLNAFLARETGQTMAEYAIVLGVITLALLAAFGLLAGEIETSINRARAAL